MKSTAGNQKEGAPQYRSLDPERIVETARTLGCRIHERFPDAGLGRVADELLDLARQAARTSRWLARPMIWLRAGCAACILLMISVGLATLPSFNTGVTLFSSLSDFFQGLESATNEIVLLGLAIFFLTTVETRYKRGRALKSLHELRSIAHIIDMHQLTKDPERALRDGTDTPSSPHHALNPYDLERYLDYCSELLAIISKIAALHVQRFNDPVALDSVNQVEDLAHSLSRNIWQKIMILHRILHKE